MVDVSMRWATSDRFFGLALGPLEGRRGEKGKRERWWVQNQKWMRILLDEYHFRTLALYISFRGDPRQSKYPNIIIISKPT